jgi:hypothetical protein
MDYEQWLEFQSFARAVMEPRHKVLLEELDKQICAPFSSTIADPLSAFSAAGRWAEKYMFHHHTNTGEKLALEMLHNVSFFALCTANNEANIEGYKLNDEAKGAIWQETRRICTQLAPYLPAPDSAALLALLPPVEDAAPVVVTPQKEKKEQREDRRLQACIEFGLPMYDKRAKTRLPDGVGKVAASEGVTRQTFSLDVKAALKRRASAQREGTIVHRA